MLVNYTIHIATWAMLSEMYNFGCFVVPINCKDFNLLVVNSATSTEGLYDPMKVYFYGCGFMISSFYLARDVSLYYYLF